MTEGYASRDGSAGANTSFNLVYIVMYDDLTYLDEGIASQYVMDNKPTDYYGLPYVQGSRKQIVLGVYEFTLTYGVSQNNTSNNVSSMSFTVGGGTQHITTSYEHTNYRNETLLPFEMNYAGAIGVELNDDGTKARVRGVDVVAPVMEFAVQSHVENGLMTQAYITSIFNTAGKINLYDWMGYAAGTVLFKGARGSRKGLEKWEINFDFAFSPHATDLVIGDTYPINVAIKRGWDYLDVLYVPNGTANKKRLLVPGQATVHTVYPSIDFAGLGIGVIAI